MRLAYPLVLLVLFAIVGSAWFSMHLGQDPTAEAQLFLNDIENGKIIHAVKQFGSNVCHCPAKGGWVSYLIYESGQEHNLAFMLGHFFMLGAPHSASVETDRPAAIPWERPEDFVVDYPVSFDPKIYEPYFLPLPLAYGKDMTQKEFNDFLKDPDKDSWKGLTLRLRPSLAPGSIKAPAIEVPSDMKNDFESYRKVQDGLQLNKDSAHSVDKSNTTADASKFADKEPKVADETEVSDEYMRKMFGQEATEYLKPKDAGHVIGDDGKPLSQQTVEAQLPRLKDMSLRLHVVRRDKMQPWTIYHFALEQPILVMPDGKQIALVHHKRPKGDSEPPKFE